MLVLSKPKGGDETHLKTCAAELCKISLSKSESVESSTVL